MKTFAVIPDIFSISRICGSVTSSSEKINNRDNDNNNNNNNNNSTNALSFSPRLGHCYKL